MFVYEKKLQYPVKVKNTNPKLAAVIISQYGGPDGELGASLRYLSQRYSMPYAELKGLLTDIGTEGTFWDLWRFSSIKVHFCGKRLRYTSTFRSLCTTMRSRTFLQRISLSVLPLTISAT